MSRGCGTLVNCVPGTGFPAVSVTGGKCNLMCAHCRGKHLKGMLPACSPEELEKTGRAVAASGGKGILISGGSDHSGRVPLRKYYGTIGTISGLGLSVNVHPGIIGREDAEELVNAGVSDFSVDVHCDRETVKNVFGLEPESYENTIDSILDAGGIPTPHLTMGFGRKDFEESSELISSKGLKRAVLLSAVPSEGTYFEGFVLPEGCTSEAVKTLKEYGIETILGCMRDRRLRYIEREAIAAGVRRAANLSPETLTWAESEGFETKTEQSCCCTRS
ncbi:MAG: radical SAM protein [Candidatus Methanomethylophilaceae archaeon]|jgi:uncharacterized radical SAM superfamily protein